MDEFSHWTRSELIAEIARLRDEHVDEVPSAPPLSGAQCHRLMASAPMGMYVYRLDESGALIFQGANKAADDIVGLDNSRFIGLTIEEAFPPLADTELPEAFRRVVQAGEPWHTEQVLYEDTEISGAFEVYAYPAGENILGVLFQDVTAHRITERTLRERESAYRGLIESSPDGIIAFDLGGNVVQANARAARLHGYDAPEEMVGCHVSTLLGGDGPARAAAAMADMLETGVMATTDFLMRHRAGFTTPGAVSAALLRDAEGVPKGYIATTRDVSEQQRTLEQTRLQHRLASRLAARGELESALRICVETACAATAYAAGGAYLFAADGNSARLVRAEPAPRFVDAVRTLTPDGPNPRLAALMKGDALFLPAERLERIRGALRLAPNVRSAALLPVRHGDKTVACLALLSHRVDEVDERDRLTLESVASQLETVVARILSAEKLVRARALLEAAIQNSPAGVIVAEAPTGRILMANRAALGIRGETSEPLLDIEAIEHALRWRTLRPDGSPFPAEELPLSRALSHGETSTNVEVIIERDDGEQRWVLANAGPVRDASGDITAAVVLFPDITERKAAERELRALEVQLAQSQKMEAIGRLAGGVAHDFNNILTGISGYCEMIQSQLAATSPLRRDVSEIRRAAGRAAELTAQLLAFSRRQVVAPRVLQLNEIVDRSRRMIERIIGEDVDLGFSPGPELRSVKADPTQIDQILVNLATNSRDAMPDGGRVTVETANVHIDEAYARSNSDAQAGDWVMLAVSDEEAGIDPETLPHVFEPFFSTKEMGRGTGLGLSTVYGIVKQNGGFINVYSELGRGTTFRVYFPSVRERVHAKTSAPAAGPAAGGSEHILLVEDEDTVRALARRILESGGYAVTEAANGEEALTLAAGRSQPYDLLLTDVVMPRMNGRKLHENLKETMPDLPVLFMSGYTDNVIAHHGVLEPGVPFLSKPFTVSVLLRRVRDALDT